MYVYNIIFIPSKCKVKTYIFRSHSKEKKTDRFSPELHNLNNDKLDELEEDWGTTQDSGVVSPSDPIVATENYILERKLKVAVTEMFDAPRSTSSPIPGLVRTRNSQDHVTEKSLMYADIVEDKSATEEEIDVEYHNDEVLDENREGIFSSSDDHELSYEGGDVSLTDILETSDIILNNKQDDTYTQVISEHKQEDHLQDLLNRCSSNNSSGMGSGSSSEELNVIVRRNSELLDRSELTKIILAQESLSTESLDQDDTEESNGGSLLTVLNAYSQEDCSVENLADEPIQYKSTETMLRELDVKLPSEEYNENKESVKMLPSPQLIDTQNSFEKLMESRRLEESKQIETAQRSKSTIEISSTDKEYVKRHSIKSEPSPSSKRKIEDVIKIYKSIDTNIDELNIVSIDDEVLEENKASIKFTPSPVLKKKFDFKHLSVAPAEESKEHRLPDETKQHPEETQEERNKLPVPHETKKDPKETEEEKLISDLAATRICGSFVTDIFRSDRRNKSFEEETTDSGFYSSFKTNETVKQSETVLEEFSSKSPRKGYADMPSFIGIDIPDDKAGRRSSKSPPHKSPTRKAKTSPRRVSPKQPRTPPKKEQKSPPKAKTPPVVKERIVKEKIEKEESSLDEDDRMLIEQLKQCDALYEGTMETVELRTTEHLKQLISEEDAPGVEMCSVREKVDNFEKPNFSSLKEENKTENISLHHQSESKMYFLNSLHQRNEISTQSKTVTIFESTKSNTASEQTEVGLDEEFDVVDERVKDTADCQAQIAEIIAAQESLNKRDSNNSLSSKIYSSFELSGNVVDICSNHSGPDDQFEEVFHETDAPNLVQYPEKPAKEVLHIRHDSLTLPEPKIFTKPDHIIVPQTKEVVIPNRTNLPGQVDHTVETLPTSERHQLNMDTLMLRRNSMGLNIG